MPGFQSFYDTLLPVGQFLADNLTPILYGVGTAITVAVIPPLVTATATFLAAAAPIVALVAAGALLYKAWESDFLGIRSTVTEWWNTTLQPAFEEAAQWLKVNIPIAIAALVLGWNTYLLPALQAGWSFLTTYIFPAFSTAWTWLSTTIPAAVQTAANFWNGTLLPAFQAVANFLNTYIFPFFQALANVHFAIVMKASQAAAGFWQKVLLPAFTAVQQFVDTKISPTLDYLSTIRMAAVVKVSDYLYYVWQNMLLPALRVVWGFIESNIGPVMEDFKGWLGSVSGGVSGVASMVGSLISRLNDLANAISNLSLPDWLTPGSPTPWEIGLRGIGDALQTEVNPQIRTLIGELAVAPVANPAQIAARAAGQSTTNYYGPVGPQLNMPVYTNNSPAAIQQSAAIAASMLP